MRLVGRNHLRRGVLILPSLFTLGNLFCGFYALVEATKGRYDLAALPEHFARAAAFIAIAMVLDGLDGRIARLAHATSTIGIELDSLADVVSFGVAPGVLVYCWALADLPNPRLGWAVAFIYVSCGALRLARFNVLAASAHADSSYFVGLPIPWGAAAIVSLVYLHPEPLADPGLIWVFAAYTVVVAALMVSTIRYRSFKQIDFARRHPVRNLLWVVVALAALVVYPEQFLVAAILLYVASAPVQRLLGMFRRESRDPVVAPPPERAR